MTDKDKELFLEVLALKKVGRESLGASDKELAILKKVGLVRDDNQPREIKKKEKKEPKPLTIGLGYFLKEVLK